MWNFPAIREANFIKAYKDVERKKKREKPCKGNENNLRTITVIVIKFSVMDSATRFIWEEALNFLHAIT